MLSFDLDGVSGLLNRLPETARLPSALSRAEFGPRVGIYRILVPGYVADRYETVVHEVGHHAYMHEPPPSLGAGRREGGPTGGPRYWRGSLA